MQKVSRQMRIWYPLPALLLSLLLFSPACDRGGDQAGNPDPAPVTWPAPGSGSDPYVQGNPRRYLALGDSYTIGEGVTVSDRWPVQLADRLQADGIPMQMPEFIAYTGWTTTNLIRALNETRPEGPYDMVSLLIGVNNQFQRKDPEIFTREFTDLLNIAIALAGDAERVLVLSIPDYGATPFGASRAVQIAQDIDRYNELKAAICRDAGVTFVDITPISREAKNNLSLLAWDLLHPSGLMYARWVDEAYPAALKMLE
jgi:lysophospholipase L1-like esterase